ncbi:MAG: FHA domain-containing protein [Planctomycetota bacterium]
MLTLIQLHPDERRKPQTHQVRGGLTQVIGRRDGDIVVNDSRVSRRHAEVSVQNGVWVVRDLGSSNGTWVNGEKIAGLCELEEGDRLQVGRVTLVVGRVEVDLEAASPAQAPADLEDPGETAVHASGGSSWMGSASIPEADPLPVVSAGSDAPSDAETPEETNASASAAEPRIEDPPDPVCDEASRPDTPSVGSNAGSSIGGLELPPASQIPQAPDRPQAVESLEASADTAGESSAPHTADAAASADPAFSDEQAPSYMADSFSAGSGLEPPDVGGSSISLSAMDSGTWQPHDPPGRPPDEPAPSTEGRNETSGESSPRRMVRPDSPLDTAGAGLSTPEADRSGLDTAVQPEAAADEPAEHDQAPAENADRTEDDAPAPIYSLSLEEANPPPSAEPLDTPAEKAETEQSPATPANPTDPRQGSSIIDLSVAEPESAESEPEPTDLVSTPPENATAPQADAASKQEPLASPVEMDTLATTAPDDRESLVAVDEDRPESDMVEPEDEGVLSVASSSRHVGRWAAVLLLATGVGVAAWVYQRSAGPDSIVGRTDLQAGPAQTALPEENEPQNEPQVALAPPSPPPAAPAESAPTDPVPEASPANRSAPFGSSTTLTRPPARSSLSRSPAVNRPATPAQPTPPAETTPDPRPAVAPESLAPAAPPTPLPAPETPTDPAVVATQPAPQPESATVADEQGRSAETEIPAADPTPSGSLALAPSRPPNPVATGPEPSVPAATAPTPEPSPAPAPATPPRRVVYVVDTSGSMVDSMNQGVLTWLSQEIRGLSSRDRFTVLFFRSSEVIEVPPQGLKSGDAARDEVLAWFSPDQGNVRPRGRSEPFDALQLAGTYEPTEVVILSDDKFGDRGSRSAAFDARDIAPLFNASSVTVNTVQFYYQNSDDPRLEQIAQRYGGTFEFVEEPPFQPEADGNAGVDLLGGAR